MTRVSIIGSGSFGSALSLLLYRNQHAVTLWGRDFQNLENLKKKNSKAKYLKNISLPNQITLTSDLKSAVQNTEILVLAVPTQAVRSVAKQISKNIPSRTPIVSMAKGLELKTSLRNSEILKETLGSRHPILVMSGPSHAEEIANNLPCSLTLASSKPSLVKKVSPIFHSNRFRVYSSSDVTGVEIGGAIKNIIAIAAGICDGLKLGDNAKAALVTRGLVEIKRFGKAEGAQIRTFDGLSGLGDLITTCFSPYGRNRALGNALGKGKTLKNTLQSIGQVIEGIPTTYAVMKRARQLKIDMPICQQVEAILKGRRSARVALENLMARAARNEI